MDEKEESLVLPSLVERKTIKGHLSHRHRLETLEHWMKKDNKPLNRLIPSKRITRLLPPKGTLSPSPSSPPSR